MTQLRKIAGVALCVRDHQGQAGDILREWDQKIEDLEMPRLEAKASKKKVVEGSRGMEALQKQMREMSELLAKLQEQVDSVSKSRNFFFPIWLFGSSDIFGYSFILRILSQLGNADFPFLQGRHRDLEAIEEDQEEEQRRRTRRETRTRKLEEERLEEERLEKERLERERLEKKRLAKERKEREAEEKKQRDRDQNERIRQRAQKKREDAAREKLEEEQREEQEWAQSWTTYQERWVIFRACHSIEGNIQEIVPWPVKSGSWGDVKGPEVKEFFEKAVPGDMDMAKLARKECGKWHPDTVMMQRLCRSAQLTDVDQMKLDLISRAVTDLVNECAERSAEAR